ncbi:hypothetical protein BROUX41_000014 [Berkeleyomyces rouxiae]|uniref:uncharacterized protein n=1 Tax=Berkeleyomyces rouxiae TaxID=2035830 RepID=UPI003B78470F
MIYDLESLIERLVLHIATCGFEGCSVADLIAAIEALCGDASQSALSAVEGPSGPSGSAAMVWHWIVTRPDVYVGSKHSASNRLSLSEILAMPESFDSDSDPATCRPRVFASDETLWKAIAGHGPDFKRVPKFEWEALVGIASTRGDGIIQSDLCRLTGQDKRSLPKRTDALAKKKYIEKRATLVRGTKTSKLWLRRFAPPLLTTNGNGGSTGAPAFDLNLPKQIETDNLQAVPWAAAWTGQAIDYFLFGKTIVSTVRAFGVLRYDDLRRKLGIRHQRWQMRVMARSCRFFVKSGALQFVAASMNDRVFRDCLKFVHDVSPDVWSVYLSSSSKKLKKTRKQQIKEEEARPIAERRHKVPQHRWTPDVPFQDIIMDIMLGADSDGITNTELTAEALAPSFGRYVANLSMSITAKDLQPTHLKHLQIRSELTRNGKTITYRYYPAGVGVKEEGGDCSTDNEVDQTTVGHGLGQEAHDMEDPALKYGFPALSTPAPKKPAPSSARAHSSKAYKARKKVVIVDDNDVEDPEDTAEATPKAIRPRGRPRKQAIDLATSDDRVEDKPPEPMEMQETEESNTDRPEPASSQQDPPEIATPSTPSETPRRGRRKAGTRKSAGAATPGLFTCPTCEGSWKNDIGLKYHQTKSRTSCNPNWDDKPVTPKKVAFVSINSSASRTESKRTRVDEAPAVSKPTTNLADDSGLTPIFRKPASSQLRGGLVLENSRDSSARVNPVRPTRTPVQSPFRPLAPGETFSPTRSKQGILQQDFTPQTPLKASLTKKSSRRSVAPGSSTPATPISTSKQLITTPRPAVQQSSSIRVQHQQALSFPPVSGLDPTPREAAAPRPANTSHSLDYPEEPLEGHAPNTGSHSTPIESFVMPAIPKPESLTPEALQMRRSKEIIRYLVRSNQGVFPAKTPLWQALCHVWQTHFSSDSIPSYEFCLKAARDCGRARAANDHLVEITYGFKDRHGSNSRCHILVEARVDKQGPAVEALKNKIKESYPTPYVPEAFAVPHTGAAGDNLPPTPMTRRKRALGDEVEVLNAPLYRKQVAEKAAQKTSFTGRRRKRQFSWSDIGLPRKRLKELIEDDESMWENPSTVEFLSSGPVLAFIRPNECLDSNLAIDSNAEENTDDSEDDSIDAYWDKDRAFQGQAGFGLVTPATTGILPPGEDSPSVSRDMVRDDGKPLEITHDQIDPRLFAGLEGSVAPEKPTKPNTPGQVSPEAPNQTTSTSTSTLVVVSSPKSQFDSPQVPEPYNVRFADIISIRPSQSSPPNSNKFVPSPWPSISMQWFESESSFTLAGPVSKTLWERALQEQPPSSNTTVLQTFAPTMDNLEAVQTYRLLSLYPNVNVREKASPQPRPAVSAAVTSPAAAAAASPPPSPQPRTSSRTTGTPSSLMGVTRPKGRPSATQASFGGLAARPPPPAANAERTMAAIPEDQNENTLTYAESTPSAEGLGLKGTLDEAMTAAFISVRTLLGGTDKAIDWGVMMRIFPGHSLISLRKFWVRLLKDQTSLIKSYTDRFQNSFIKAYEKGDVPALDFDNLDGYNWRALVNWTVSLHKDDRVPLPKTREGFRAHYELGQPTHNTRAWRDTYYSSNSSIFGRYEAVTSEAAVFSIDDHVDSESISLSDCPTDQALARSWLRSLAVTPGNKSSSAEVIAKFMTLAGGDNERVSKLLEGAVAVLSASHIISKGKILSQRDRLYRLNKQFRSQFDKAARQPFFMEARTFKRSLDATFQSGAASLTIPFLMPDGAVMALINMTVHQRLRLCGDDIPHIPRGFDPGNYESRKMSKALLLFSLNSAFAQSYLVSADIPILAAATAYPIPMQGPGGMLPFWVDFFGDLDLFMWQAVLGMICSLVSTRGPLSERTILDDLHALLDPVDVKLAVAWATNVGLLCSPGSLAPINKDDMAESQNKSAISESTMLTVSEWWWLVVAEQGPSQTEQDDARADEAFQKHTVMLNTGRISA